MLELSSEVFSSFLDKKNGSDAWRHSIRNEILAFIREPQEYSFCEYSLFLDSLKRDFTKHCGQGEKHLVLPTQEVLYSPPIGYTWEDIQLKLVQEMFHEHDA